MRKLGIYVEKYGADVGPKLYHVLQSQAGHASVGARLRRKIVAIREKGERPLPLFDRASGPGLNPDAAPLATRPSP